MRRHRTECISLLIPMSYLKKDMKRECYSVESLHLRKVQMTEMPKDEILGLMKAQIME